MNPKKRSPIALSLLFTSILVPLLLFSSSPTSPNTCAAANDTPRPPGRTIRVGGDNNYPPYEYVDANGDHKTEYLKIVGEPLSPTTYSAVVLKGNTELLKLLNKGIEAIKKNGTYNKIYGKWFGEEIIDESRVLKARLTIALSFAALIWMALLVIFYWNRTLKRKIDDHTRLLREANQKLLLQKEQLEKSNRLKEKILENSLNGIIACDLEGNVLSCNSMAQTLLNLPSSRPDSVPGVHIPGCFEPQAHRSGHPGQNHYQG
ncbi:MAG: transporter substrate-binding domain-containing protein [Firmicutes bacterium]|nr:transporter substrate-binding domain-containing protein [Bacillota bacterium]